MMRVPNAGGCLVRLAAAGVLVLPGSALGAEPATSPRAPEVGAVSFCSGQDRARVEIRADGELRYQLHRLSGPDRLYFDLPGARLSPTLRSREQVVNDPLVSRIRMAVREPRDVRIVLDLKASGPGAVSVGTGPSGLVIEIERENRPVAVRSALLIPAARKAEAELLLAPPPPKVEPAPPPSPAIAWHALEPAEPAPQPNTGISTSAPPVPASFAGPGHLLAGKVVDPTGALVAGALVILDYGGQVKLSDTTDASGSFRFERVPPGAYQVRVEHPGFKSEQIRVRIGGRAPAPLEIPLTLDELRESVNVDSGRQTVSAETAENLDTVRLDQRALRTLPGFAQDPIGAVQEMLDPASTGTTGATVVVDGMETKETGVSRSAIQEVRINQNPYSAEFSRPGLGRIEVVTKTGSSAFHGEFNFVASDYRLNARNAFAAERPREHYRQYEGNISGPLGKGRKASFLISGEYEDEDERPIIYAIGPNGPIQENVHNPKHGAQFSARLNRQVGRQNMLSLRYEFEDESQPTQGVGGFVLHEAGVEEAGRNHHVYLNQRTFVTKSLINDLSVRIGSHNDATRSLNAGAPGIVVLDAFTGGGAQADARSTENHLQLTNMLSWSRGRHFVKTGISIPDFDRRGLNDRTNFGGTFYFSSLQDYALGRPFSYVRQQGQSRLVFWHKELSLFFQDDIRIRPNLSVAVGLRYDWQNYLPDRNNFAPRFSFAYSPGSARKTVLRGGAGVFYDKTGPEAISDVLRLDGRRILRFVVSNPGYPVPVAGGDVTPPSVVRFAPDVQSPYVMQYSFGVERQLRRSTTFTSNYTGTTGVKFFRSRDVNAPPPPAYAGRPNPAVGILRQIESSARQESHSLRLGVRGDMSRFFNGSIEYTLGRAYNDTGGIASFPADHYDLRGEWARADFDKRHLVTLYGTVKLGKLADLGVVSTFSSGQPYSLTTGLDLNRDSFAADRPSGVRRNTLTGSGRFRLDLRWSKEWPLSAARKDDGPKLSFGIEAYNVLNFVSYDKFVGNLSSPLFGLPVSSRPSRRLHLYSGIRF